MRVILYTGKGGVGKTSIAAATACKIASSGKKVLIISTDKAHSLGDSFDCSLSNTPKMIFKNCFAMEVDTVAESEKAWGEIKDYIKEMLTIRTGESIETEELLVFPGFEELFSLFKIMDIVNDNNYDVLIVDCAPTGATMSLLKFPEMFGSFIEKILPMKRKTLKIAGPMVEKTTKIPMPKESIFDEVEVLLKKTEALRALMLTKEKVSIRIVTTPEKIVVKEAKRNFSYLHLYDYNVDGIIVNKIYPQRSLSGYFNHWIVNQEESLRDIKESFIGIPVFHLELLKNELRTIERLEIAGNEIYGERNPEDLFFKENIFKVRKIENGQELSISLPFVDKNELDLIQKGEELLITVKNQKRNFVLPGKLKYQFIKTAKYEDGQLKIIFLDEEK